MAKAIVYCINEITSLEFQKYHAIFGTATISKTDVIIGSYTIPIYNVTNIVATEETPEKTGILIVT